MAPGLLGSTLRRRVVTLLVLPTARAADVTALRGFVGVAGGTVGGTVRVGDRLLDVADKQLVDELGSQLAAGAPRVDIPADASPYERIGRLLGRAVGTPTRGGDRVDGTATTILGAMDGARLASAEGRLSRRGDLVLVVAGTGQGSAAARRSAGTIVSTLAAAVDAGTAGVVLAGPTVSARAGGAVATVRGDIGVSRDVSTVDTLDRSAGQVVSVLALAGQAAGRSGQYGTVDAADGPMPGARQAD